VNVASLAGILGDGGLTTYAAWKGALIAFTRTLAVEPGPKRARCNTVAPGQTRTEGLEHGLNQERKGARLARILLNRFGEPEDVGNVIALMLSPKARHIIGQVLSVDGGASIFGVF
jgi:NAD(P)-dependent dehydrogenase (short-subunit alcohol dehydrogenase family)